MDWISKYWKTVAAIVGAVVVVVVSARSDGVITNAEWVQVATAFVTALTVYLVPDIPSLPVVKILCAAILAGLGLLTSYLAAGNILTESQWYNVAVAVLTVLGVSFASNVGDHLDRARAAGG